MSSTDAGRTLAEELLAHCYGGSPRGFIGQDLLNTGRFPDGWVAKYLDLIQDAERQYAHLPNWPRELIAAAYVTSVYCDKRYRDWLSMEPGRKAIAETEASLQRVRWAGDNLILGWHWRRGDQVPSLRE
jgi:hypothetical protein